MHDCVPAVNLDLSLPFINNGITLLERPLSQCGKQRLVACQIKTAENVANVQQKHQNPYTRTRLSK